MDMTHEDWTEEQRRVDAESGKDWREYDTAGFAPASLHLQVE
jgi:hypothetical protein